MNFEELKPETEAEWLELRTKVLTATDSGVILGLNPWKSVRELVESKAEYTPINNAYTMLGQWLEPVVVSAVNATLDTSYELFDTDGTRSFFADEELGLGATPDAGCGESLLECKSTKPRNFIKWAYWPPAYYLMQLYTQLICTGRQHGLLAVMSTNLTQYSEELNIPLHIFELVRTPEIDAILIAEVERFWEAVDAGKLYRVNRKQAVPLELKLRFATRKIR